ncbi:hypothetical protein BTA30_16320 [Bacillus swezeyi]|uniref:Uncharacterized protein n=1 Tax=Bacillus swezeyi TaxID=1925020 RepID=A0A1R1QLT7_9BACI|nr:hypothetical protein BW143_10370 [Bacillus swezeyi]OMI27987.1 hypothetical protein BTA30_16320 [Bacillus swezeyi]
MSSIIRMRIIVKNRLKDQQTGSKSPLNTQNAMACSQEQIVKTREIGAAFFHNVRSFLCKYMLMRPLVEIKRSSGKNDQFQAMMMSSSFEWKHT